MVTKLIKGLNQVQSKYDAFFIDLWGVMHNGIKLYPSAVEVLENLHKLNKRFVLMSNAPRPSKSVKNFLTKLKLNKIFLENVFTSGEAALQSLKKNAYGKNFYHLGPNRDNTLFEGFEKNSTGLDSADFILCTGLLDGYENSLDFYRGLLQKYTRLKMVCTNPDLVVDRGFKREYCAGKLAEIFKDLGGKVIYFGKPHPEIYKFCVKKDEKVLIIGDNIRTDIKGANNMNFDSLFVTNGIHKDEFINLKLKDYDKILDKYKVKTNYYQKILKW